MPQLPCNPIQINQVLCWRFRRYASGQFEVQAVAFRLWGLGFATYIAFRDLGRSPVAKYKLLGLGLNS